MHYFSLNDIEGRCGKKTCPEIASKGASDPTWLSHVFGRENPLLVMKQVFQQDLRAGSRVTKPPQHQGACDAGLQHEGPHVKQSLPEEAGDSCRCRAKAMK